MSRAANFNVGMLVGMLLSTAITWWAVSHCVANAPGGVCVVTVDWNWQTGVLHFEPRP